MLTIQHVSKTFGSKKALVDVSFEIHKGEIVSLIGPNSSGKSTLVKSIVGLLQPTSGTIAIDGHSVASEPQTTKALVGYIPDEPSVWPVMTGKEFIAFTQALFAMDTHKKEHSLSYLLDIFHLQGLEQQSFEEYSRGNRQKFSILAALSHSPKLLVIDEPIVGLDPTGAERAKKLFSQFATDGGSVLLVTHTLPVAEEISHRIGFLKDGVLVALGTLSELRSKASLSETASLEDIYKHFAQN